MRSIAGCEVSVVYDGTLPDVDGVGNVLIAAVNSVVDLVSLVPDEITVRVLDLTCVQAFYISPFITSKLIVTELTVAARSETLAHCSYWQTCRLARTQEAGGVKTQQQG